MKEKKRYLQPCPTNVPAHDPRKLLYCIYLRLQPQINLGMFLWKSVITQQVRVILDGGQPAVTSDKS